VTEDGPQSPTTVDEPSQAEAEPAQSEAESELAEQLASAEDRYRRALADLDNLRKRTAREIERRIEESRDVLLLEWLEALDSVERALGMTPGGPLQEGLRSVLGQMEGILARHGVRRIGERGEPFDPARHDAVAVRESEDAPDRSVIEVARSGFAAGDRVLRPAQVIVSRRPEPEV
jgi:molecular chaperone GrpE